MDNEQKKLNSLCKKYGVTPFKIGSTVYSEKWRILVLKMCGVDIEDISPGRPSDPKRYGAGVEAYIRIDLDNQRPVKRVLKEVAEENGIKPTINAHGKESDIIEVVNTERKKIKAAVKKSVKSKLTNSNPDIDLNLEEMLK